MNPRLEEEAKINPCLWDATLCSANWPNQSILRPVCLFVCLYIHRSACMSVYLSFWIKVSAKCKSNVNVCVSVCRSWSTQRVTSCRCRSRPTWTTCLTWAPCWRTPRPRTLRWSAWRSWRRTCHMWEDTSTSRRLPVSIPWLLVTLCTDSCHPTLYTFY